MTSRVLHNPLNGRLTTVFGRSYDVAKPQTDSNYWSCTENNRNNGRNVNFNNGNANNNNKYNSNTVRAVSASDDYVPADFISSVWEAYHDCMRGKRRSAQAVEYMQIAGEDIPKLAHELWTSTYKPGTSTCFLVRYPKLREVFAAGFRDRIVHHWVCLRLNPLFEARFESQGNVSFNCRKGFGTDAAVEYVAEGMRRVSDNYHKPAWVFRGDLVGFFMSINKDRLWYFLERFIRRKYKGEHKSLLLATTKTIVMHRPEKDCVLNSPSSWWKNLAPNKSLFTTDTGMPIGNLTTQLFANFYMSFFVAYVQFLFRRKNYIMAQFVDDFIIACDDLPFLMNAIRKIDPFLSGTLLLTLHHDKRYLQPVSHGVLFIGTFIKPGRLYLSNRTVSRLKEHSVGYEKMLAQTPDEYDLQRMEQTMNSYLGFCQRRKTYKIRKEAISEKSLQYFVVRGHYDSIRLKKKFRTFKP